MNIWRVEILIIKKTIAEAKTVSKDPSIPITISVTNLFVNPKIKKNFIAF